MASEEEEASNLLQQGPCFFFYDSFHQEETADPEEIMLFFYPEEVPVQTKLFLLGGCSAMIAFAKNFTEQAVDVVSLKGSTKMAFKQLPGDVTLVLTSNDRKEEDATLCAQLDNLCRAFWFYNGPFEDVLELHRELSRKELLLKFKQIGSLLIPLLQSGYNKLSRTFDVLPYTELPYSNRYFLSASRLLNEIRADCNNIGGSLFYEQTVVCTHLDSDTTRWILNITQIMGASTSRAEVPQYAEEAQKWLHHPFISTASLKASLRWIASALHVMLRKKQQNTSC
ncbi:melanosome assembly [Balamuthia mandrillaris]